MITGLVSFKPPLEVKFEGKVVGALSHFHRETVPLMGGSNRKDCFPKHTPSGWYLTVPSASCSCCSTPTLHSFYELVQWWWCKPIEHLKDKTTIREMSKAVEVKQVVFLYYMAMVVTVGLLVKCF